MPPNHDRLDALFRSDTFAGTLGVDVLDWGLGWADAGLTPTDAHRNFVGSVHGGLLFAIGDVAFSIACNSYGRLALGLTVDTQFLSAPPDAHRLLARARERSLTGRTGAYLIEILAGHKLVASVHAMAFRTSSWHFGEHAWDSGWRRDH